MKISLSKIEIWLSKILFWGSVLITVCIQITFLVLFTGVGIQIFKGKMEAMHAVAVTILWIVLSTILFSLIVWAKKQISKNN